MTGERQAALQYDSQTGGLRLRAQTPLTTLEIQSQSQIFTGTASPGVFISLFDVVRPDKLFKLVHSGFAELDYGPIAKPGLENHALLADICARGSWKPSGIATLEYAYPGAGTVPINECGFGEPRTQAAIQLEYESTRGELTIHARDLLAEPLPPGAAAAEEALLMTTLELRSQSGAFVGPTPPDLSGPFDQHSAFRILKQDRAGFESIELGPLLAPGLTAEFVRDDILLDVTFLNGHAMSEIEVIAVPEPAAAAWWAVLALALVGRARRSARHDLDSVVSRAGSN
jgi:hypothetical protein